MRQFETMKFEKDLTTPKYNYDSNRTEYKIEIAMEMIVEIAMIMIKTLIMILVIRLRIRMKKIIIIRNNPKGAYCSAKYT